VVNALSTTFALKGKASVLHNSTHLFFGFFFQEQLLLQKAKSKLLCLCDLKFAFQIPHQLASIQDFVISLADWLSAC